MKSVRNICILLSLLATSSAMAGFDEYSDRGTWAAAASPDVFEDFNSVVVDTAFHPGALVFLGSGLTLQATDGGSGENIIDTPDGGISGEVDVNGTSVASFFNLYDAAIRFSTPVSAFGADFQNLQDATIRTEFELRLEGQIVATLQPGQVDPDFIRFYGFAANAGEQFDEIRILYIQNDVFGMDDAAWSTAAPANLTPVPSLGVVGLLLLIIGTLLVTRRRLSA